MLNGLAVLKWQQVPSNIFVMELCNDEKLRISWRSNDPALEVGSIYDAVKDYATKWEQVRSWSGATRSKERTKTRSNPDVSTL